MDRYKDQIEHSKFNDKIYLLGNFEKRITVYSQQIRSVNLIAALYKSKIINEKSKICIIGAGVAGLTAAISAAAYNIKNVDVYERNVEILPIWRDCKSRWLHPNLYFWPNDGWNNSKTDLPFLNWNAARACDVASELIYQWDTLQDYFNQKGAKINVYPNKLIIISEDNKIFYNMQAKGIEYSVILICVGFGVDGNLNDLNTSYWSDDNLERTRTENGYSIFISGNSDGGISDLLRARLSSTSIEIIESWLETNEVQLLSTKINEIETNAFKMYQTSPKSTRLKLTNEYLEKQYDKIKTPQLKKLFVNNKILRNDMNVNFHKKKKRNL